MANLTLSILEIGVLLIGAIVLGITVHFFITSRRNLKNSGSDKQQNDKQLEDWKLKYFNDIEVKDKELVELKQNLLNAEDNNNIYTVEMEELRRQIKKLHTEVESMRKTTTDDKPYVDHLRLTQSTLKEHQDTIHQLLSQLETATVAEEKKQELEKENEELDMQVKDLKYMLEDKEDELRRTRQKEQLTKEMNSMLDSAYSEFSVLQSKLQKLEAQQATSKMISLEYEDLKECHIKQTQELETLKFKFNSVISENQQLSHQLHETEDKLREANFQRQQLQKRIGYLEELNNDLQVMSEANKKLEGQIKRIGELESKLNVVAEERDELMRKTGL
jgi:chromosome segregation ATPase